MKHLTADEVRALPNGTQVTEHSTGKHGYHNELRCIKSGNMLSYKTKEGTGCKLIREERGKWFTEGCEDSE